nr:phosphotransferase [Pseudomonadales bacterium]
PPDFQIQVPSILFEDRSNFVFAMTAMPEHGREWKQDLMHGILDQRVAEAAGRILATLHCQTWMDGDISAALGNANYFDELRLDPYYRQVALVHQDLEPAIQQLIVDLTAHPQCLVHGDFSPKNMLVTGQRLMLLDFEVGHFGDPAFDLGFFLTHLASKSVWDAPHQDEYQVLAEVFCETYLNVMNALVADETLVAIQQRACRHLGACLVARVDGKSPLQYLDPQSQQQIRKLGRQLLMEPPEELILVWPAVTSNGQNHQQG